MPSTADLTHTPGRAMLQEYDVICLKPPMQVFTTLPEKFLDPDKPYSVRPVVRLVPVGNPIHPAGGVAGLRIKVEGEIAKVLDIPGISYPADLVSRFVNYILPEVGTDTFTVPEGEYLVMRISEADQGGKEIIARKFEKDHFEDKCAVSFFVGTDRPGNHGNVEVLRNLFD